MPQPPQPETRSSLIARIQVKDQRNESAWTEFARAYEPFLHYWIERQGAPSRHVPDIAQQVLIRIARSVDGWRDDGRSASFRRWLQRVARNEAIKHMASESRRIGGQGQGGTDVFEALEQEPDRGADERQVREYEHELMIWAAEQVRGEFRETSWSAFWATQIEGRPTAEVAAELGVTPGAVYASRGRILARIQAKVRDILED